MSRRQVYRALAMAALVAFILGGAVIWGQIPVSRLYVKLVKPVLRLSLAIGVGLLLGIFIENANLTARLGRVFAPFLRFGHLKEPSAVAFTTAFFSAVAASTVLMNAYQDRVISRRELMISALTLTFPAFFAHLPSMFFIITPLVGVLGMYYLAILLGGDILRTTAYLLVGRFTLPPYQPVAVAPASPPLRHPSHYHSGIRGGFSGPGRGPVYLAEEPPHPTPPGQSDSGGGREYSGFLPGCRSRRSRAPSSCRGPDR